MNLPPRSNRRHVEDCGVRSGLELTKIAAPPAPAASLPTSPVPTARRTGGERRRTVPATTDHSRWPVVVPLIAMALFTLAFRWTTWDLAVTRQFFDVDRQDWPWFGSSVCTWFYRRGTYPAFGLAIAAAVWLTWSLLQRRSWRSMQASTFLLLVFVIGPGLIVNLAFKSAWGRPRPHQVEEFGGTHQFVPVGTPGSIRGHNSSFPSGHASVAFYLLTPAFLVGRQRPWLARGLLAAGLVYGAAMGSVRVIQGGHFVSDVVWSAAIVYFTAALLARQILRPAVALDADPNTINYC